jgi:hypothetical protein
VTEDRDDAYYEKEFQVMADAHDIIVGQNEIQSRIIMGDAEYEKIKAFNDTNASLNLSMTAARIGHVNSMSLLLRCAAFSIKFLPAILIFAIVLYWFH